MTACGIQGVTLHTLRHTLTTQLEDIGVLQKEIRDIIGHAPQNSTEHYQHSTYESRKRAMDTLEEADPLARGFETLEFHKRSIEARRA